MVGSSAALARPGLRGGFAARAAFVCDAAKANMPED